jgi:ATP-dependent Lhr-like helicase
LGTHRGLRSSEVGEGRWSLISGAARTADPLATETLAEDLGAILLDRWGVVSFSHYARESFTVPWRELARALRRFEAQGQVSGGRFVAGLAGEQFAHPSIVQLLATTAPKVPVEVTVCGSDPLNVTGLLLPGARVPAQRNRTVTLRGGVVAEST